VSIKIPVFEEIVINDFTEDKLRDTIAQSRIGKVPCYINLISLNKAEIEAFIITLELILLEYNIHPRFPYPLYIISPAPLKSICPWVRSLKDLPDHYFKRVKRASNKELQLLNKLSLKVDKIKNLELYKIINELKSSAASQKELFLKTKELYFLEFLDSKLFEKPRK
jgi:hypothetical protein